MNKIQEAFVREYSIMNIVFQTIDNDVLPWADARRLLTKKTISDKELAEVCLNF